MAITTEDTRVFSWADWISGANNIKTSTGNGYSIATNVVACLGAMITVPAYSTYTIDSCRISVASFDTAVTCNLNYNIAVNSKTHLVWPNSITKQITIDKYNGAQKNIDLDFEGKVCILDNSEGSAPKTWQIYLRVTTDVKIMDEDADGDVTYYPIIYPKDCYYHYTLQTREPSVTRPNNANANTLVKYRIIDWGSTQQLQTVSINNISGDKLYYQNFNTLAYQQFEVSLKGRFGANTTELIYTKNIEYSNNNINFQLSNEEFFEDSYYGEISNKNRYVASVAASIICNRCLTQRQGTAGSYTFVYTSGSSYQSSVSTFILVPFFGSLSIRKNKVGINKSDLAWNEESLVVAVKERVENKFGNNSTFEHIVSIVGNSFTKMPFYDGSGSVTEDSTVTQNGSYIGFHLTNDEGVTSTIGAFGFDGDGKCYVVEYNNSLPKKVKLIGDGSSGGGTDFPVGTIMVFVEPTGSALSNVSTSGPITNWYWCNGKAIGSYDSPIFEDYLSAFGGLENIMSNNIGIVNSSGQVCTPTLSFNADNLYYKYAIKVIS